MTTNQHAMQAALERRGRERALRNALGNLLAALEASPVWTDWSSAQEVIAAQAALGAEPRSLHRRVAALLAGWDGKSLDHLVGVERDTYTARAQALIEMSREQT